MLEKDIINICIGILHKYSPLQKITYQENKFNKNRRNDGYLKLKADSGFTQFVVEVKRILKRPLPLNLFFENISRDKIPLIMAEYINSSIASELIKKRINFIDCQGNIFINIPNKIYIEVKGKKQEKQKEKQSTILFNPKGMQLLSILLNDESLLNNSLRNLQKMSGISLERTSKVIKELKENGYIWETKKNYFKFRNKKVIFERWIENYGERLRPKLLIGTYRISSKTSFQKIAQILKNKNLSFAYGGETGAEILSNYFQAGCIDLFIPEEQSVNVIEHLKLAPAKEYNVRLFNLYSEEIIFPDKSINIPTVIPILVYAELLYQENDRATEAADIIFNKYIKKY